MDDKQTVKDNNKKIIRRIVLPIVTAVVIFALAFGGGFLTARLTLDKDLEKIDYILSMYRAHYYDEQQDVVGIFSRSLLDRYSAYYSAEEYAAIKSADSGEREGLGGVFSQEIRDNETIVVLSEIYGNSPLQRNGFKEGDVVISVGFGDKVFNVTDLNGLVEKVRDTFADTEITFTLERGGERLDLTVKKEDYTQTFVKYYDKDGEYGFSNADGTMRFVRVGDNERFPTDSDSVAVIKYYSFSGTGGGLNGSEGQFKKVMEKFKADGRKNVIIDLRGNGGGFLDIMQENCRFFLNAVEGTRPVVVSVKDKFGETAEYSSGSVAYKEYGFENILILADGGTASASEAFIGALLDFDTDGICKVIVSGGRTYGKGIMQTTYERITGEAIKLTTAKLFWPKSGICIHDVGVTTATDPRVYDEKTDGSAFYDALEFCK